MRLTAQVINSAPIILNPEGSLTLQLRDLAIPYLENLGITQDKFAVLDLTNNNLTELSNIPSRFYNLEVLLLAGNKITFIDETFPQENRIKSISLINNNISKFQVSFKDKFKHLENLALIGNPIQKVKNYRLFIIWLIPSLKILDFKKIKQKERDAAVELFGENREDLNEVALSLLRTNSDAVEVETTKISDTSEDRNLKRLGKKMSDEERRELLARLETATKLEEIEEIENKLKSGYV
ncbi:leucine-rich repeat-domain-containing protein [Scheffersomyces xylosifermentans]|uniref:leucine-rich repeat-domain-containing protein n=1 Tax=Scheffersomyces xylosifermentans TaxID=1304137 RepID=UPI00315D28F1